MKIALVTDCYLPRLGGIEVQVRDLGQQLRRAGHTVEVFTATVGAGGERRGAVEMLDGIPVHRLGLRTPFGFPLNPFAVSETRRRLGDGTFDVAHVHMGIVSPFTVDTTNVCTEIGMPTTMTWHCMLGGTEPLIRATRALPGWAHAGVAMTAVSSVAADPIRRLVGPQHQVDVLPNGIDIDTWWRPWAGAPPAPLGPGGRVELVTAMRLVGRKRPLPMLAALQRVRELVPDVPFRLTILGDGRLRGTIESFVRKQGIGDWVRLAGRLSRPEVLEQYSRSHIYLSPARLESFGIAALEARCAGLPVVGLATSGAAEFIEDGTNGFLAEDDDGMARAVVHLLTRPELRERMFHHNVSVPPVELDWPVLLERTLGQYARAQAAVEGRARTAPGRRPRWPTAG